MGLSDAAHASREKADASIDPADHALANALEAALDAEFAAIRDAEREPPDPDDYFPPSAVSHILIPKPGTEN
jgi:hypothetical protein